MPDHLFETFKSNSAKVTDFEDFKSLGNLKIFENTNENSKKFQNFEKIKLSKKLTKVKLKGSNGSYCKISGNTNHTKKIHFEKVNCDSGLITIPETGKLEPFNNFVLSQKNEHKSYDTRVTIENCFNIDKNGFFNAEFILWHLSNTKHINNHLLCNCHAYKSNNCTFIDDKTANYESLTTASNLKTHLKTCEIYQ